MKAMHLTEEHKSKLIEMCEKLCTEYESLILDVPEDLNNDHLFIMAFEEGNDYIPNCDLYMHWFEFCMRCLTPKLDELYNKIILYPDDPYSEENKGKCLNYPKDWSERYQRRPFFQFNINCNGSNYKKHPIDYLYEEFKKLTK